MMALNHAKDEFRQHYSPLLQPDLRLAISDKTSLVNSLITATVQSKLNSGNHITIKEALAEITKRIRTPNQRGEVIFWSDTTERFHLQDDLPTSAIERALFDITISTLVSDNLEQTSQGEPVDKVLTHNWTDQPKLVLLVHPRLVSANVLLRIDAQKTITGDKCLVIRWPHGSDCYTVMNGCQRIWLALLSSGRTVIQIEVRRRNGEIVQKAARIDEIGLLLDNYEKLLPGIIEAVMSKGQHIVDALF